jgi:signal transduction histidine kinase
MGRAVLRGNARVVVAAVALIAMTALYLIGWLNLTTWERGPFQGVYVGTEDPVPFVREIAIAWAFGIAGIVAMRRRLEGRVGILMVLIAIATLVWLLPFVPIPLLVTMGQWLESSPILLLGALLLVYPSGRITSEPDRLWLTFAAIDLFVLHGVKALVTAHGIWECDGCHSLITLTYDERVSADLYRVTEYALLLLAATLLPLLVRRWIGASPPARRLLTPVWLAGVVFTGVALTKIVLDSTAVSRDVLSSLPNAGAFLRIQTTPVVWDVMGWVNAGSLILVPIAFVWGLMRARMGQSAVSALAVELRRTGDRKPLVESLRRALGDPSLELGLWSRPAAGYVTSEGLPLAISPSTARRATTRLDGDDGPLALMIHDPALADQRDLVDGVTAVAQFALENERLHAEVKAQLEEVRASRERIVSAADAERRRVERNIHDGAQQRLVSLSLALSMAQAKAATAAPDVAATLAAAEAELRAAIVELRELARGIHPAILTEAGLGAALESLADHSPVPVALETDLDGQRLPPLVEATAYFVASEALTNVARHASASAVTLSATVADGWLRLRVSDDGAGGADPTRGSGLRGLLDRVAALGGRLRIEDGGGAGGTRLEAEIPCA